MPITITDTTVNPLIVPDGQSLAAYKGVTVADTNTLDSTETVSITLSQTLSQALGLNYYFYPTVTNFGSISDPNGGGSWNKATETFTESGLVAGDPTFATDLLSRLLYNAPQLPNGQAFATQASITVTDGGDAATDATPVIVGDVTPPDITGTVANEPIASGDPIRPFATVTLTEPWFYYDYYTIVPGNQNTYVYGPSYSYPSKASATIKITDGGQPTDADGLLTGPGLSYIGVGTYSLGPDYAWNIQNELRGLSFQTVALAPGAAENPKFELDVTDTTSGLTTTDIETSVLSRGPTPTPVPPYIAGTQSWPPILPGSALDPFASVTVSDGNKPNPMDSATITLTDTADASNKPTDANGTLSGTGLTETAAGSGVYTLGATLPSTLTSELDSLTFRTAGLPSGVTSETTRFTLAVSDPTFSTTATDSKTTVTAQDDPKVCFLVHDNTTGQSTEEPCTPYTGPVAD